MSKLADNDIPRNLADFADRAGLTINDDGYIVLKCAQCGGIPDDAIRIGEKEPGGEIVIKCFGKCRGDKVYYLLTGSERERILTIKKPERKQRPTQQQQRQPPPRQSYEAQRDNDDPLLKVLPQSEEAEMNLLGAAFFEDRALSDPARGNIIETLRPEEFYHPHNRTIFKAMIHIVGAGGRLDPTTVVTTLRTLQLEDRLPGGLEYLQTLAKSVPTALNIKDWADIVHNAFENRKYILNQRRPLELAYRNAPVGEVRGEAERVLNQLSLEGCSNSRALVQRKEPQIVEWSELKATEARRVDDWIVDGLLARREDSLWSAKVEHGKTTALRSGLLDIARGDNMWGELPTKQTVVLYLMMDSDGRRATYQEFEKLGMTDDDGRWLKFMFEPTLSSMDRPLEKVANLTRKVGAGMVVLDTFPRASRIKDMKDYELTYFMAELSEFAQQLDVHLVLVGHIPRGRSADDEAATAGYGSIIIGGSVNVRIVISKKADEKRTIRTSEGKGGGFKKLEERILDMDPQTHRIRLGELYDWKKKAEYAEPEIEKFLDANADQWWTLAKLCKETEIPESVCRTAAKSLHGRQKIKREGGGTRGDPYLFASFKCTARSGRERKQRDDGPGGRLGGILDS